MPSSICRAALFLAVTLLFLSGTSFLSAQRLVIPDVEVDEDARWVDVPIYVNAPDSASALQFGLVWAPLKLRLDTVKFGEIFQDENFAAVFSQPMDGEARVLVVPALGVLDVFSFSEDSAAVVLTFELLSDFKGSADVRFNDDFPRGFSDYYANGIPVTVSDGSITDPNQVTSNQNITPSAANIKVYPNPAKNNLQIRGLPSNYRQSEFYIMDKLGRRLWSGKLTDATISIPEVLPNGQYWLVINLEEGTCSKPIVILR